MVTPEGGEALPTLTLRGGTSLAQTLTFRVVNRFGGGMPGLGLNYTLEQGDEASCARFDEPGATDVRGEVTYAGASDLTAGVRLPTACTAPTVTPPRCSAYGAAGTGAAQRRR